MQLRISYRNFIYATGLLMILFTAYSCSTKKNTLTRRIYHNITSRYNVYFNGRESLNEGRVELIKGVKDNYQLILPVFNFGTKQEAQQRNPQMDRAIQKASMTIQKHSMPFGGMERVRWIDDAYLLIGKAYFYKQEYFSARRTFNFIIQEYGYNDIKYDAMIWLALTYNQTQEFEKSEPLLNLISSDVSKNLVPQKVVIILPQVYADLYIRQERYDQAVEYLFEAIAYNPKRDLKTRMMFILAQIYQQNGDLYRASEWYTKVIKRNPVYDMAFQSKINLARSYDAQSGDRKLVTKLLTKMLKDDKNKDYKDQIYYALSEVALRDQDTAAGMDYLRLSVATSVNNNYQKATSSLTLADLYFNIPSYENAQAYYDTAMMFIPKDYPDYNQIERKTRMLNELVQNLIVIHHEDSLLRLANMSDHERNLVIDKLIADYREEQKRLAEQQQLDIILAQQRQASSATGTGSPGVPIGGKWYFYNVQTREYGLSEFIKKWGQRNLDDLWRISDKQVIAFMDDRSGMDNGDAMAADTLVPGANDPTNREYYMKDLPFSEEAQMAANKRILDAYFQAGRIYKDGLMDNPKAEETFRTMNTRYPDNDHMLQAYYYLYKIFSEEGQPLQAEHYKSLIINNFPESDYAKLLIDPEYFSKLAAGKNQAAVLYEDTYLSYKAGQYFQVIAKSDLALATYGDTIDLAPRFEYLRAVSIGRVDIIDSLVASLQRIILKYPNSEIKTLSQGLLAHIVQDHPELADDNFILPGQEPAEIEKPSPYSYNGSGQHMFMMVVDSREIRLNPFKVKVSDHNQKFHRLENLTVNSLVLDKQNYIVTVGNFNNASKALDYLDGIIISDYVYADIRSGTYHTFVISTENYPIFFKEKDLEEYRKFYGKHYK
ncbi:MAG: tetratricopeptide repeat protein [Bacteroidales bacterium]